MSNIVAAAVQYIPMGGMYPHVVCAKRHCDCYEWLFTSRVNYDRSTCVEGFFTEDNQFVDRCEAMIMALECGQVEKKDGYMEGQPLYSEDLW